MSGVIISVLNNKGGTAKTVTTVSLGQALAKEGKKVLVIDNDTQANATDLLLEEEPTPSLYDAYYNQKNIKIEELIYWVTFQENLYCLPNDPITASIEPILIKKGAPDGFSVLRDIIRTHIINNFDFCLIDNPPNMGIFVINSLYASDFALVPTDAGSKASVKGLIKAIQFIEDIKKEGNRDLRFLRVLLTKLDRRTSVSRVIMAQLKENFSEDKLFKNIIPINTDIQKAELRDQTIFKYNPKSGGAKAYREVARELINIVKG